MKQLFLLIMLTFPCIAFTQHLTFDDLHYLYKNNLEKCDLLLTTRGFIFNKSIQEDDGTVTTQWLFKRGASIKSSNEYFTKNCKTAKCDRVTYLLSDSKHFNSLKVNAVKKGAKFLWTDSDKTNGLSFYYMFVGPTELSFTSLPSTIYDNVKVFMITFKEMKIEVK